MGMQAPDRTNAEERQVPISERIVTGASCETVTQSRGDTMLTPLANRPCSSEILNGNIEGTMDLQSDPVRNAQDRTKDLHNGNIRIQSNLDLGSNCNSQSPTQSNTQPSENSPSGSSELLTGGTGSSSSRNTRTSSSTQRRQRRRRSSDRRMRTSSSNYSTSSTDHSSKSNGGIRQTARARQQQLFSTSSSSDSEDNTPQRPRRLVAKMVNGTVTHELEVQGQSGQPSRPSRPRKHSRGSRHRQRPVSAQPSVGRQSLPPCQSSTNNKGNVRVGVYHDRLMTTHGLNPSSIQFNQQGRVKQKRPDSLDLKLIWSSHRGYLGHSSLSTSSSADSYDPWIPRDGVTITTSGEKLTVSMAKGETVSQKVPDTTPACIKKKQLHRVSEGKNHRHSPSKLPVLLQQPNSISHARISPKCESGPLAELGLPCSNTKREHITPEKDIDTTECSNFLDNSTRDRPKSMVEFNKDTSILVSEILSHADADISPAVKNVLQDIHSVIEHDDRYLNELWQSACILDKYANKCSQSRSTGQNGIVRFKDNREQESVEAALSKAEQLRFRHSCPDADDMQRQAEKMLNVSRAELVKSLEDARETIL
ncbi:uncharacterized protein [Diadema setosum]|uniref:uncharacterized protein n=1 Tax=Diadema setosum TaxID=31175 RepID=UPI003B3B68BF